MRRGRSVEALIPKAGQVDEAGLLDADPVVLARYIADARNPWWRRRPCVLALRGRVPPKHVMALIDRIRDPDDTAEVRIALLDVLHDRAELLPWLQAQDPDQPYGMHDAILKARAGLGDLTAAPALATLAADAWHHHAEIGRAALDVLAAHHGIDAVSRAIGNARPEDRAFHIRMQSKHGGDVSAAFEDADVAVARLACECVIESGVPDDETLVDRAITSTHVHAKLWALYALHRRGREIRALWHAIDAPRREIAGLPDDVRLAILREEPGEARTDPHWLVERACVDFPPPPDEQEQLARVIVALRGAGLSPGTPREIGEVNQQGGGTYHVIELAGGSVLASTLGPFVTGDGAPEVTRPVLEAAGFRWIDDDLGGLLVEGLCVYYFGRRDPLDVRTLLFYWQD